MSAVCSSSSATAHLPVKKRAYLKNYMNCMNNLNLSDRSFLDVTWCLSLELIAFFYFLNFDAMQIYYLMSEKIYITSFDPSTYKRMDSGV